MMPQGRGSGVHRIFCQQRPFTAATTGFVAIGCWLFSITTTVTGLFLAVFATRFAAQGLWGVCAQVSMARYFHADRGKAAAVSTAGYALGFAIFPLIGAWLLMTFGWREAWAFSAWFVVLVILPLTMFQLWGHGKRHLAYEEKLAGPVRCSVLVPSTRHVGCSGDHILDSVSSTLFN